MREAATLTCIESFCGPGGLALGLSRAGFEVLTAFDNDEPSVRTHQANLGGDCFVADAREVDGAALRRRVSLPKRHELDLFSGGPPCQGFSKQKRGAHLGDQRNTLVLEFARLVRELTPRAFLFENVAVFGQRRGRRFIQDMQAELSDYRFYASFYNSADYGLAQTRERFFIAGLRRDLDTVFIKPKPTHEKWVTVSQVLRGIPEPPTDYSTHPRFPNHQRARVTPLNIKRFSYVPQGGGWRDIPEDLRLPCHKGVDPSSGGWPDVYGRLHPDGQCPTITGGFDSFTRGRYGHPFEDRPLTPREAARLQGFPDDYVFLGNRGQVRSQIGNVVPPPLAAAVGRAVRESLLVADGILPKPQVTESQQLLAEADSVGFTD